MLVGHNGSRLFTKQISSDVNRTVGSSELKDTVQHDGERGEAHAWLHSLSIPDQK